MSKFRSWRKDSETNKKEEGRTDAYLKLHRRAFAVRRELEHLRFHCISRPLVLVLVSFSAERTR
jgi:hypothetical protein